VFLTNSIREVEDDTANRSQLSSLEEKKNKRDRELASAAWLAGLTDAVTRVRERGGRSLCLVSVIRSFLFFLSFFLFLISYKLYNFGNSKTKII
jgi:hypothetical protein